MPNLVREVVSNLSLAGCESIMREAEDWERSGVVPDDAILRVVSEKIHSEVPNILVLIMNDVVREVWRRLAWEYLNRTDVPLKNIS